MKAESLSALDILFARALELELSLADFLRLGLYRKGLYQEGLAQTVPDESDAGEVMQIGTEQLADSFDAAQQRLSSLLSGRVQSLVDADSAVLLVGHSFGTVMEEISAIAQISREGILDFEAESRFDVIVIEGSITYLDQLAILSKSRQLLNPKGQLLLFGEFLDDDSAIQRSTLPNLSSLKLLSRRLGFELRSEADLTASAIASAQQIISLLNACHDNPGELLRESNLDIDACIQALRTALSEFKSRRRCFRLFHFSRIAEPGGEYAQAEYAAIDSFEPVEIADLFQKSFNVDFDAALWRWKYQKGDGRCVVARSDKDGPIVAHYGGAPRHIYYFGSPAMAIQVCDVMVLPEIRRQYGKSSLFFKVAASFLEREIGNTVKHLLGFGFPNQKAMNIAMRLGLYEKTDDFVEVIYPRRDRREENPKYVVNPLDQEDEEQQRELDGLWDAMRKDFEDNIIGVRDWGYIQYRYFEHPFATSHRYQCVTIRNSLSTEPLAIAILQDRENYRLIMDLICPRASFSTAISALNQKLSESSQAQGLKMWITRGALPRIMSDGAIVNELGIEIPCNSWNPGPSAASLYGRWWLTAGDMDFM